MRDPRVIGALLALVQPNDKPACLSCNVAAKFLRLMSIVLDVSGESGSPVKMELYSVMSKYVTKIAEGLLFLLKLSKDACLDMREQVLCLELSRFVSTMMIAVPGILTGPGMDKVNHLEVYRDLVKDPGGGGRLKERWNPLLFCGDADDDDDDNDVNEEEEDDAANDEE